MASVEGIREEEEEEEEKKQEHKAIKNEISRRSIYNH